MRAGKLRQRVTLLKPVVTGQDDYGEEEVEYQAQRTVWAQVEPLEGREFMEARLQTQELSHRIRMRYQPDISLHPSWRIQHDGRTFLIESVANRMERDREWVVMCRENV